MKKLGIFLMSFIALALTSCDDYKFENPEAPSNAQEEKILAENVANALSIGQDLSGEALDLNAFKESEAGINVMNIGEVPTLGADQEFKVVMQLSKNEDFSDSQDVNTSVADGKVYVSADDWAAVHVNKFSKSPKAKMTYYRFLVYLVKGGQTVKIGEPTTTYLAGKVNVTPYPTELVIEENYYLLGTINGWSVATAIKFDHTGDQYDNPVFTLKVEVSESDAQSGWWWKIVPESTYKTGNWVDVANASFGVAENGDEAESGMLMARTDDVDCGAGCLKKAGQLLLTINLEEGTYAFTSAVEFLYTPGGANGWNQGNSMKLRTTNYVDYEGYMTANGEFKFCNAPDWDHTNYGFASEGKLSTDGGNISVAQEGLYYAKVNTASLDFTMTYISTIGVIGDATPGGWNSSTALTPSDDFKTWTGEVKLEAKEFKFRANDGWDINLGGSMDDLQQGGDNIKVAEAGTYVVTLNLGTLPYTATLVKK